MNTKKLVAFVLILSIFIIGHAQAAATPPESVWVTLHTTVGDSDKNATLNAFVYNNTTSDATVVVDFTVDNKSVATTTGSVPKQTGKTLSVQWTLPLQKVTVTASVKSATDANKKHLTTLEGILGTVNSGGVTSLALPDNIIPKDWATKLSTGFLAPVEAFRVKQSIYFTEMRDTSKIKAEQSGVQDIANLLVPDGPGAPGSDQTATQAPKNNHAMDYATLMFASMMSSFFSHQGIFYIALVLVALFLVRFIFRLF